MNKTFLPWLVLLVASVSAFATIHNINVASELKNLNACASSDTIKLMHSIQMSGVDFSPLCPDGFYGVFDGGDSTIENLNIRKDLLDFANIAFVAILGNGGVLKNVTFVNANIDVSVGNNSNPVNGSVAIVVGKLQGGSIENVHVRGGNVNINGENKSSADAGGVAGTADSGSVSESDGNVNVNAHNLSSSHIGGICGSVTGDVILTSVSYTGNAPIAGSGMDNITTATKYGAITVNEKNSVKTAVIDGAYTGQDTIKISNDVSVNSVEFTRSFTENTMSTLMLPFSIDTSKVKGGKIYRFKRVDVNEETKVWKVIIGRIYTEQVGANTPYLVLPTADKLTFEGPVTFNTVMAPIENAYGLEAGSTWEFKGVYAHTNFDDVQEDGPMYAFAGQNKDGAKVGQFKSIGSGVKAYPMQAYLVNHGGNTLTKSAAGSFGHIFALPDVIDIEIEDENGIVVETGKLNTVTGEVRMDRWFDLKGRKLNSKPTVKGTYYKNGKGVIVK